MTPAPCQWSTLPQTSPSQARLPAPPNPPRPSQSTKYKMRHHRRAHKRTKKYNRDEDQSQRKTLRNEINKELQDSLNWHTNGPIHPLERQSGSSKKLYSFTKPQESHGAGMPQANSQISATSKEKTDTCNRQPLPALSNEQGPVPALHVRNYCN